MTLVELLVVLVIIFLLAAATIPRLRPEMDRARIREAVRSIQLYLSSARDQAIATGRPCGVMIERLPAEPRCSMALSQAEAPVPYAGDAIPSLANVTSAGGGTVNITFTPGINATLVKPGDLIQLGLQGPLYTITAAGGSTATIDLSQGLMIPWTSNAIAVPFRIFRQPVKSVAAPLQLPSPTVIDLTLSGPDTSPAVFWDGGGNDTSPVLIMFAADGSIDHVYINGVASRPNAAICLLVGKRQNVNDPNNPQGNLQDFNSLWVAINPSSGLIVTTDLAATGDVSASRLFARQSSAMGGK